MKKRSSVLAILVLLSVGGLSLWLLTATSGKGKKTGIENADGPSYEPYEFLFMQRSYPDATFDVAAYRSAMHQAAQSNAASNARIASTSWTVEGPRNIGGRINCVVAEPGNSSVIYAGTAAGGIFKTTNAGTSWNPVFDNQPMLAIGCLAIDPTQHSVVWAGTGDANLTAYPYLGDGIYKSTNGGGTWTNMGLSNTHVLTKIVLDPSNANVVYASAMGLPMVRDANRGIYKSSNGGITWNQVLFVDSDAGVVDMVMDPFNHLVLYAASFNCIRNNHERILGGPDTKIWKSTNGGATWTQAMTGIPASTDWSRIGLAVSAITPNTVFAVLNDPVSYNLSGVYKSTNAAGNWQALSTATYDSTTGTNGFGWYFGKIFVNPADDDNLYIPGVELQSTPNSGFMWAAAMPPWYTYQVHADGHDMFFISPDTILYATDGGLYMTTDNCITWTDIDDIPVTQYYRLAQNPFHTGDIIGGAQDNGTSVGNASAPNSWDRMYGGDGFQARFNPQDSNTWYVETQNGGIAFTVDDGFSYNDGTFGIDQADRCSWDMPYVMSASNPSTLHTGTFKVYEMTGAPFGSWVPISGDLTDGIIYDPRFHVITAIDESALNEQVLYAGTSDGNAWVTQNDGGSWTNITAGLPDRYVTSMHASPDTVSVVYVTHSGYRSNDYIPHIHRSRDYGNTWTDISGNLPQVAVNDLAVLPGHDSILFAATDAGVYMSQDAGVNWSRVGNNMPVMPVFDIELYLSTNKMVAATFARSAWSIDLGQLVTGLTAPAVSSISFDIFPNPVADKLSVRLPVRRKCDLRILDSAGKRMLEKSNDGGLMQVDVSGYPAGIYFAVVISEGTTTARKFLKQ